MHDLMHAGVHWSLINFFLFVGLLFFLLRKPVKDFWASRAHRIRFDIEEAEKLQADAQRQYDELKMKMERIESEVRGLIVSLQKEGDMEKKKLMEDASLLAARIKGDSEKVISQEVRKAREALKAQAAELAVELAEGLIREKFSLEDQSRLARNYLAGLERHNS